MCANNSEFNSYVLFKLVCACIMKTILKCELVVCTYSDRLVTIRETSVKDVDYESLWLVSMNGIPTSTDVHNELDSFYCPAIYFGFIL